MTELSFDKVRELQRQEKKETSLAGIEADFYPSLAMFIKQANEAYKGDPSAERLRELENSSKLARDLFDKREQKILMKALRSARGGEGKEQNMTPEEKKAFDALVSSLRTHREFFEGILGGKPEAEAPSRPEKPKTLLNKTDYKIVLVRVLKEIPKFVGSDAKEYGPFKQKSMVKLPEKEAGLLLKRNLVEKM